MITHADATPPDGTHPAGATLASGGLDGVIKLWEARNGQHLRSLEGHKSAIFSVVFDPTLARLGTTELMGHYVYDDEGVKGRRVTVVDRGVLKTFLLDRAPLRGFPESNGHGRAEAGYVPVSRQSNLVVESNRSMSIENLTDMLRTEAKKQGKPFGLLFDNIEGGFTNTGRGQPNAFNVLPNVVYRIYTDEKRWHCLGMTKAKKDWMDDSTQRFPRHPLYVPAATKPVLFW